MSLRKKIFKGGMAMGMAQGLAMVLRLLRSIIVARLVTPEDFGIAAAFVVTVSFLEMISNLGLEKMLVQSPDGGESRVQNAGHSLLVLRGLLLGMVLLGTADLVAALFKVPDAVWAFRWLAAIPLIRGLSHLDLSRMERELRFGPSAIALSVAQVVVTIAAVPLALWLRDYSAMLWLTLLEAVLSTAVVHLLAESPYRWAWDPATFRRFVAFGWPLLMNGLLMFGIFQGDRLLVGMGYDMRSLGVYSVAFTIAMLPVVLLAEMHTSLFLPVLAQAQNDPEQFARRYRFLCAELTFLASAIAVVLILAGGHVIVLLYGRQYGTAAEVLGWLAAAQSVRLVRAAPTLAAIARADTHNSMYANFIRIVALPTGLIAVLLRAPLVWLAIAAFGGELLAMLYSVVRLRARSGVQMAACLKPFGIALAVLMVAGMIHLGLPQAAVLVSFLAAGGLVLATAISMVLAVDELRQQCLFLAGRVSPRVMAEQAGTASR